MQYFVFMLITAINKTIEQNVISGTPFSECKTSSQNTDLGLKGMYLLGK
jgi:hypothetical protein